MSPFKKASEIAQAKDGGNTGEVVVVEAQRSGQILSVF